MSVTATYVSTNSFKVLGENALTVFPETSRVLINCNGTWVASHVTDVSFDGNDTTVTLFASVLTDPCGEAIPGLITSGPLGTLPPHAHEDADTGGTGVKGSPAQYVWDGTEISFRNNDGSWGPYVDLGGNDWTTIITDANLSYDATTIHVEDSRGFMASQFVSVTDGTFVDFWRIDSIDGNTIYVTALLTGDNEWYQSGDTFVLSGPAGPAGEIPRVTLDFPGGSYDDTYLNINGNASALFVSGQIIMLTDGTHRDYFTVNSFDPYNPQVLPVTALLDPNDDYYGDMYGSYPEDTSYVIECGPPGPAGAAGEGGGGGGADLYGNVIINGNFDVWQLLNGSNIYFYCPTSRVTADRWIVVTNDTDRLIGASRVNASGPDDNSYYSMHLQCYNSGTSTPSDKYTFLKYVVEGYDYKKIRGKTCTLSFWVKAKNTGTYSVVFQGNLAAGLAATICQSFEYSVSQAETWEQKTITVTFDYSPTGSGDGATTAAGLNIIFSLTCGSDNRLATGAWTDGSSKTIGYLASSNHTDIGGSTSNYLRFARVQLNEGETANDFAYRSYGREMELCQRYLQVVKSETGGTIEAVLGMCRTTSAIAFRRALYPPMRIAPTTVLCGVDGLGYDWAPLTSAGANSVSCDGVTLSTNISTTLANWLITKSAANLTVGTMYWFGILSYGGMLVFNAEYEVVATVPDNQ